MGQVKIMSASAGSGKTYNLAYEYVRNVIAEPSLYRHILAVTFTNKATAEMKERILAAIDGLARGGEDDYRKKLKRSLPGMTDEQITANAAEARSRILHDYGHFSVFTIDAFFQRIIRAFLKELGINLNFNVEMNTDTLLGNAADRLIDESASDGRLRRLLETLVDERLDEGQSWSVKHGITTLGREIFREEYKSRAAGAVEPEEAEALFRRIMADGERAKKSLAKPAKEFLDLLAANSLGAEDINGGGYIVSYVEGIASGGLRDHKELKSVDKILSTGKWHKEKHPARGAVESFAPQLDAKLREICAAYDDSISAINTAKAAARHYNKLVLLEDLRRKAEELAREENLLYISEVNGLLSRLIAGNDAPFIYEKAGNYFSHFMIDEFQDTSAMQWANFKPLLHNALSQSPGSPVLLVGDVKQSIYRWRGGDWSILAEGTAAEFSETERSSLDTNFRSRAEVVKFVNAVIGRCVEEEAARLDTKLAEAAEAGRIGGELRSALAASVGNAYRDHMQMIPEGKEGGYVTVTNYEKNEDGVAVPPVIELITELQERGYAPKDITLLVRRKSEGQELARMLLEHKKANRDPRYRFDIITQEALVIGNAPVVIFAAACLKLSANPGDTIAAAQYNQRLGRGFGESLPQDEGRFVASLRLKSPQEAFEAVVIRFGLGDSPEDSAYLQAFHSQIISFTGRNIADIPLFLQWWEENGHRESITLPAGADAITIDTIHKSKGLGFKAVILPYCNWSMNRKVNSLFWASPAGEKGVFPVNYEQLLGNSAFSEDYYREYVMSHIDSLNMFYVAVTRAKEELHIMIPPPGRGGDKAESIDNLVKASFTIDADGGEARIGGLHGSFSEGEGGTFIEFGTPERTPPHVGETSPGLRFRTVEPGGRVKLRLTGQRFFDEGAPDARLAPRDYGVLMHGLFENAADMDEIAANAALLKNSGGITGEEEARLAETLAAAMSDGLIRSWFDGSWEEVRNEADILMPGGRGYRPDRVMSRGGEAVVVDYKFGLSENPGYKKQVARYMSLLSEMGYESVKGYVWYVHLGRVEEVS